MEDYSMDEYNEDVEDDETELELMKRFMKPNGLFRKGKKWTKRGSKQIWKLFWLSNFLQQKNSNAYERIETFQTLRVFRVADPNQNLDFRIL